MYINLILGAVFFAGLWVLLRKLLVRETVRDDSKSADDAGEILARELEARRSREKQHSSTLQRLNDAGNDKLDLLEKSLEKMRAAMPEEDRAHLSWVREETGIRLKVAREGANHVLALAWVVPDLDIGRPEGLHSGNTKGYYRLRYPDAREEFLPDLDAFIRKIAAFIADILA